MIEEGKLHRTVGHQSDRFGVALLNFFAYCLCNANHVHTEGHPIEQELFRCGPQEHRVRPTKNAVQLDVNQPQTVIRFVFGYLQDGLMEDVDDRKNSVVCG